ncbi:MAG: MBL fold metallo-hydrolase [Armatimonadota bacterium]|nr:MBL fold metallo-hydrolase [Armatimonadota bacterium]
MRKAIALLLILISACLGVWLGQQRFRMPEFAGPTLHIAFIDVPGGESALIQTPDGRSALVDAGRADDGPAVVTFLRRHGVTRLDLLLLTRRHPDHIGGVPYLLESVPVDHVVDCGCSYSSEPEQRALREIFARRIPYKTARAGQVFHLGNPGAATSAAISVLLPEKPLTGTAALANNKSVVTRVSFGGVSALLLSDIGPEEEARLIASDADLSCDVVKVSGNASSKCTSNELLRLTKPAYAVITVKPRTAAHKRFDREIAPRMEASGVSMARTDEYGAVIVATDGRHIRVSGER